MCVCAAVCSTVRSLVSGPATCLMCAASTYLESRDESAVVASAERDYRFVYYCVHVLIQ